MDFFHLHNPSCRTMTLSSTQLEYLGRKGSQSVKLTIMLPSCADCHEIWEFQLPGILRACPNLHKIVLLLLYLLVQAHPIRIENSARYS